MTNSETGFRNETNDGKATHFRSLAGILCKSKGDNRQASPRFQDVNCKKCLAIIARIKGAR